MGLLRREEKKVKEYSDWWKTEPLAVEEGKIPHEKSTKNKEAEGKDSGKACNESYKSFGFPGDVISSITYKSIEGGKKLEIHIKGTEEEVNRILAENKEKLEECYGVKIDLDEVKLTH